MRSNRRSEAAAARLQGLGGDELLALAGEAVRRAAGQPPDDLDDGALVASVGAWHRLACAVHAATLQRVAAVEDRQAWRGQAYNGVNLWTARLGISRGEAKTMVDSAVALERMPQTAARLAAGTLSAGHVADAARTVTQLDRLTDHDHPDGDGDDGDGDGGAAARRMRQATATLDGLVAAEADRHSSPTSSAEDAADPDDTPERPVGRQALRQQLDAFQREQAPELLAEREQRLRARRSLRLGRDEQDPDHGPWLHGRLAPLTYAKAQRVLHAVARQHDAGDPRTFAQRCHDAFDRVLDLAIASGQLPDTAGEQPRVLLTVDAATLHDEPDAPPALLDGYGPVSTGTARQICCDAEVTTVTRDGSEVLDVGRDRRKPTRRQRRAVWARDHGCAGCAAPLATCEIHHIVPWNDGGPTDLDNLVAVCWDCHARIHHYGWRVIRDPGGTYRLDPPDARERAGRRRAS